MESNRAADEGTAEEVDGGGEVVVAAEDVMEAMGVGEETGAGGDTTICCLPLPALLAAEADVE